MRIIDLSSPKVLLPLYKEGTSLNLVGAPGIGKSAIIREFPRIIGDALGIEMGYNEDLVPSLDAPDCRGFLIPTKDEHGRPVSKFTYPPIMPSPEYLKQYPCGIDFKDEFEQGDNLTKKTMAPYILEGAIGGEALPRVGGGQGWWVITASNRMEDKSGTGKPLMHLINRQRTVYIDSDLHSWVVGFAEPKGLHPLHIAYAKARPGVLFSNEVPANPRPYCTPRSFTAASKLLAEVAGTDGNGNPNMTMPTDGVTQELVAGDVGNGTSADMYAFFKVVNEIPTIDDVLKNPTTAKVPKDDRLDAAYAAVQLCIHHSEPKNVDKLWTYVERLPLELQTSAAKSMLEKGGGALLNSKALGQWVSRNRTLIMSTTG